MLTRSLPVALLAAAFAHLLAAQEQFGDFRANSWRPFNSASDDLYIDAEPGTRLLRTRNWNSAEPNIRATGIHTGEGIFDTSLSVFAYGKISYFTLTSSANHSLDLHCTRSDGARVFHIDGHTMVADFGGKVGIGTPAPAYELDVIGDLRAGLPNSRILIGAEVGPTGHNNLLGRAAFDNYHASGSSSGDLVVAAQGGANIQFGTSFVPNGVAIARMTILDDGKVGIGTTTPTHELSVNGGIRAKEVIVEATSWSDFVFEPGYRLRPLSEVESHIAARGHLPDVPSAAEIAADGLSVGEAQRVMMQKIEELTLYVIDLQRQNDDQARELESLRTWRAEQGGEQ